MSWITFAYSLPKSASSLRVSLWRRLQRIGAVAPAGNFYVLPALNQCVEAFQWLTQEIQQKGGQAIMAPCDQFMGMSDREVIEIFCQARGKDYNQLLTDIDEDGILQADFDAENRQAFTAKLTKLRRQFSDIQKIDYFDCPEGVRVAQQLNQLEQKMVGESPSAEIVVLDSAEYQGKTWLTRPRPHVDRLSTIWLIRRFIDANAVVRYGHKTKEGEITFDMPNAHFGHVGNLCTFETVVKTFQIAGLEKFSQIIHEIDLNDGIYNHPETVGIAAILQGWLNQNLTDQQLEANGLVLFDGLLAALKN